MFGAQPRGPLPRAPIGYGRQIPPGELAWKLTWPYLASTIIAIVMLVFFLVIFGLEIASLATSTWSAYGNTSSTGAGIWCGVFVAAAGVLILLINWMSHTRLWATIALIATIVAACFMIILLGLDARAVDYLNILFNYNYSKPKVLAAQLAFSIFEFLLCLAYIGIYVYVLIMAPKRFGRRQQAVPYQFPR